jgi:hypothetical protein
MSTPFRHTRPLPPKSAADRVAEVYEQISRDFGIDRSPTFVVLSSALEILVPA